ncbi:DUF1801 domain-containing protein [Panacibacter ginsenosidivorans]|uniref:DUF1801 domain-containing protein n=1 Tax=Panacibacter ginsenosidivorans TaxID=1813871 RepID=A0A5B8V6B9_9BACT|nr:DUF1801 domain-containing protein [Panacibacter ginsenosidivorans]QEC66802.1 DUF1801 domain-containing protein [Panacibacter ginsenosidivorans]
MFSKKSKPATIEAYIDGTPEDVQDKLHELHKCIRKAAPGASEGLKWGMPAYSYKRILVTFAVFKKHIGFYPTPSAVKAFAKELEHYKTAEGSVQFPLDKKLPLSLITKMVKFRVQESLTGDAKWKV